MNENRDKVRLLVFVRIKFIDKQYQFVIKRMTISSCCALSENLESHTLSGETILQAKFASLYEKFVTFARRKISLDKSKSVCS